MEKYFATKDTSEMPDILTKKFNEFDTFCVTSGRWSLWLASNYAYNSAAYTGGTINSNGVGGAYKDIKVNHYRNFATHIKSLVAKDRITYDVRGINTQSKTDSEAKIGSDLLTYCERKRDFGRTTREAMDIQLVFGDAYAHMEFDSGQGIEVGINVETGQVVKSGDVVSEAVMPFDVAFDFTGAYVNRESKWYIVRKFVNKYELAEEYKFDEQAYEKILNGSANTEGTTERLTFLPNSVLDNFQDYIVLYTFYHKRCNVLPNGRVIKFTRDVVLSDGPIPAYIKEIPLYRLNAEKQKNCGFGYSIMYDLLPIQQAINTLYSIIVTNQKSFGVQNIIAPRDGDIDVEDVQDGLNFIKYDSKFPPPAPLQLLSTPAEIFEFIPKLEQVMETLSGVNSVVRGQPESNLKSGTALALIQGTAVQFVSNLQNNYVTFLEEMGMGLIDMLKNESMGKIVYEITGENNSYDEQSFEASKLDGIRKVIVDLGNATSKTLAGRIEIATNLLNAGKIPLAEQYIEVINTGNLEPILKKTREEMKFIQIENENIRKGIPVKALASDNNPLHYEGHSLLTFDPQIRNNPDQLNALLAHMQEHQDLLTTNTPQINQISQQGAMVTGEN